MMACFPLRCQKLLWYFTSEIMHFQALKKYFWDIFLDIFYKWHFHNASKQFFWKRKIKFQVPFCQNVTFEPLSTWNFKKMAKRILLKHYESVIKKNPGNVPRSSKSTNKVSQSTIKGVFYKNSLRIWKNIFVLGSYESLERLEG